MANLGMADSLILMVMALVVFGPRRLPQIGRQIGKLMYEFRKASNDFKFQMEEELRNAEEADRRKKEEERLRALALAAPVPATVDSQVAALGSGAPETTGMNASETTPAVSEMAAGGTPNPAAGYDNGPVASTQIASMQAVDTAPTIRPPSTGQTVAAVVAWNSENMLAKAAEVAKAAEAPTATPSESSATASGSSDLAASSPAKIESTVSENISSQSGSSEAVPEVATQAASIAVNHHG